MPTRNYALITPARNEEKYIEETIKSVISQTILPQKWIIVSDGSTDNTDDIVLKYSNIYDFIVLIRKFSSETRNFASKVSAINSGFKALRNIEYSYLGNLDADVYFEPHYYEKLIDILVQNPKIGISGGIVIDYINNKQYKRNYSLDSVAGAVQFFRRECYEEIGGYLPIQIGGVDTVAEIMARMNGWKVYTYPDLKVLHFRKEGTAKGSILYAKFRLGIQEYTYGSHPLFEIAKVI